MNKKNPAIHNQAIMEFGAIQCKPVNPDCLACPLNDKCFAFAKKRVAELPVKIKKTKVRNRYFNYIVFNYKNETAIKKRTQKDIWTNLYDFPLIENDKQFSEAELLKSVEWKKFIGKTNYSVTSISPVFKHVLSHQHIYARFWEIKCDASFKKALPKNAMVILKKSIGKYAVPRLVENYLEKN